MRGSTTWWSAHPPWRTCATTVSSCSRPGAGASLGASCLRTWSQPSAWPPPRAMAAPALLERIRTATEGPLLLVKGPEVARLYPDPALRCFRDLDILVPDAPATQRQLLAAGFQETGDPSLYERSITCVRCSGRGCRSCSRSTARRSGSPLSTPPPVAELIRTAVTKPNGACLAFSRRRRRTTRCCLPPTPGHIDRFRAYAI